MTTKTVPAPPALTRRQKLLLFLLIGLLAASTTGMITLTQTPHIAAQLFVSAHCRTEAPPPADLVTDITAVSPCWLVR